MSDLIRRADAIDAVCMNDCGGCRPNECGAYLDKSCDVVKALSALPSADITETETCQKCQETTERILNNQGERIKALEASADAVQGEWIDIDNYYRLATCSHCHKVTMFEKWGEYTKPYDFCPNCGARMKGADNEID